jgi:predicted transcriptional regulator
MKRKQTRRAFGLSEDAYNRVTNYAERNRTSRSAVIEKLINKFLDRVDAGDPEDLTASRTILNLELRRR